MCDFFWQRVETTDQGGDLADIVRASGVSAGPTTDILPSISNSTADSWQQLRLHGQEQHPAVPAFPTLPAADGLIGNPLFGNLRDPLLHEVAAGAGGLFQGSADAQKGPHGNLFSRVLQISPKKAAPIRPLPVLDHGMPISSSRASGIKRRKSQAKKVVCIPAPAASSNKTSGEVVPSDLWAWRKYGQKPIKGSPYPRGYYRCSSSKGCSARKQVERSRTDPNMLVITYTSEHNHPWPTQRNALAGSTRSQPSKNSTASTSKNSPCNHNQRMAMKEEPKETITTTTSPSPSLGIVKEEVASFDQIFFNEPPMMDESNHSDDFFADLAELDPDPISLIFSRPGVDDQEKDSNKAAGSFIDIFDWGGSSFGDETKKGL